MEYKAKELESAKIKLDILKDFNDFSQEYQNATNVV